MVRGSTLGISLDTTALSLSLINSPTEYITQELGPVRPNGVFSSDKAYSSSVKAQSQLFLLRLSPSINSLALLVLLNNLTLSVAHCGNSQRPGSDSLLGQRVPLDSGNFYLQPQIYPTQEEEGRDMATPVPVNTEDSPLPKANTSSVVKGGKKGRSMPTRRSKRLQAQQKADYPKSKPLTKAKSQMYKIPFLPDSHMTPLDTSNTIEALKATGIQISNEIEQMIDEAIKLDQAATVTEQTAPSTPLHDPIPPLSIPGTNLFL